MNTKISYLYRDAANYKQFEEVVVSGEITSKQEEVIRKTLQDGTYFIPEQVGLIALQERMVGYPSEDDHCWHELEEIKLTEEEPTLSLSIDELTESFSKVTWLE